MSARRAFVAVSVVAVLAGVVGSAGAEDRVVRRAYMLGFTGDVVMHCEGAFGGMCIDLDGTASIADIAITDDSARPVGARYGVGRLALDVEGPAGGGVQSYESLGSGSFCGSVRGIDIPKGSDRLFVALDGPVNGPSHCLSAGSPGVATSGTITVSFRTAG